MQLVNGKFVFFYINVLFAYKNALSNFSISQKFAKNKTKIDISQLWS